MFLFPEEELVCLGSWKEGRARYLVGKINHTHANMDEDRYRCFMSDREKKDAVKWNLAQSGDATCQGLNSATEGAKTMKLFKSKFLFSVPFSFEYIKDYTFSKLVCRFSGAMWNKKSVKNDTL